MIKIDGLSKSFQHKEVLRDLHLVVAKHEFLVLIGESGSGKSTLLKCINELAQKDEGEIWVDGKNVRQMSIESWRRQFGYVFQHIGLFPHMTVKANISLVPAMRNKTKQEQAKTIERLLAMVNLSPSEYAHRYPSELSGGQQQRVGVARAFATEAPIMLMDEPFSALDPMTRSKLQVDFLKWKKSMNLTVVFVTHDMAEATLLADRLIVMQSGQIVQEGTIDELKQSPANEYVQSLTKMVS